MFSKRKNLAALEMKARHTQREEQFDAAVKETDQIADPAEKIIALRRVREDISSHIKNEGQSISREAQGKQNTTLLAGSGTAIAAATAVAIVTGPIGWVGFPVLWGGVAGAAAIASKRKKSALKSMEKASVGHFERMESKITLITDLMHAVVEGNVKEISKSPLYEQIKALPGITEKFADAAAKQIIVEVAPPAVEAAPPVAVEQPKQKPKAKPNYDKITKFGKTK